MAARPIVRVVGTGPAAQSTIDVDLLKLHIPDRAFSADAVTVQPLLDCGVVHLHFVAATATLVKPQAAVRVRFPTSAVAQQVRRDVDFMGRLEVFVAKQKLNPNLWTPELEDIAELPLQHLAAFEGTFTMMAHFGETAVCDIFRLPPDFALRESAKATWEIEPILRVNMPTVVLLKMLRDLTAALAPITVGEANVGGVR